MNRHENTAGQTPRSGVAQLLQLAANHRGRFHDAHATMVNQLRAVSTLFGTATGNELVRSAEAMQEQHEEAVFAQAQAFGEQARENEEKLDNAGERIVELHRLHEEARRLLYRAAEAEQARHARTPAARRKIADWYRDAAAAGYCTNPDEAPF